MATKGQKVAAVATGAAIGGGTVAAIGLAAGKALQAASRVAPVATSVATRVIPAVAITASAASATVAAARSYARGESTGEILKHAAFGAVGLDSYVLDATKNKDGVYEIEGNSSGWVQAMKLGGPKDDPSGKKEDAEIAKTIKKADHLVTKGQETLSRVDRLDMQKKLKAMEANGTLAEEQKRLGIKADGIYGGKTLDAAMESANRPSPIAITQSEAKPVDQTQPTSTMGRLIDKAGKAVEDSLFGPAKEKADDALAKERRSLDTRADDLRARMKEEYSGRGGAGKNYDKLKSELNEVEGKLSEVTKKQAEKEKEELAAYRQVGAVVVGGVVGGVLGKMTLNAAKKAAEEAGKGIAKLADKANKAVAAHPKGVIAGTIDGDKAAAAVAAAKAAAAKPSIGAVEAYALPALNVGHGAGMIALSQADPNNPASPFMRMEGTAALVAGLISAKLSVGARAMRAIISPATAGKLLAAEKRLAREARGGVATVAQANARAKGGAASALATEKVATTKIKAAGRIDAAKIDAKKPAITAAARVGVAKAEGASKVGVAEARGKQAVSRQLKRGQTANYKDTWMVSRKGGKSYVAHRKDMSIRTRKNGVIANDNGTVKVAK